MRHNPSTDRLLIPSYRNRNEASAVATWLMLGLDTLYLP